MTDYINPPGKLLHHIDRIADLKAGKQITPINLEVDLSNRCSLGCEWCHFAYTHTRGPLAGKSGKPRNYQPGGDLMHVNLAHSIIEQAADCGVRSITWTGGGEPTLHPQFDAIINYADVCHVPQGIYTHGGHIAQPRAELMSRTMTWVYISLDATSADEYKRRKGVDRFENALEGARNLVKAKGGATIGLGFLLDRDNWQHTLDAVHLGERLGVDYVNFRPIIEFDLLDPGQAPPHVNWIPGAIANIEQLKGVYGEFVQADTDRFKMYHAWQGHGYHTCWWSRMQTVITPSGIMWTCVNKREHANSAEGDLATESLADILRRKQTAKVDGDCRVMCRGHVPNLTLDRMMQTPSGHDLFV